MEEVKEVQEVKTEEKKKVSAVSKWKSLSRPARMGVYLGIIVMILVLTNPSVIPFMPDVITEPVQNFVNGIFGDMDDVARMIRLDWSVLFQLSIMALIVLLIREVTNWLLERYRPTKPRAITMKHLIASALKYILAFAAVLWALAIAGVDVSTLFAGVGVVALIIGFGAESLIADVITGLFMIFENQYNVGDIIELDGYRGTVVNIAIRTTSIQDSGGNIKIFNNSDVRNIINLTADSSRAVCDIPIPYEADIDEAEKIIAKLCQELSEEYPEVFKEVPECSGVQALGDSAVVMRVVANTAEEDRFKAARLINKKLKMGLEKAGMGAPYAQVVMHRAP